MEFKPLYYSCLVLCVIIFFEVLINIRKNSLLKVCFLVIVASLFVMNYFSYNDVSNRAQLILIKISRGVYLTSVLMAIIHLISPKIPRWIVWLCVGALVFFTGARIYNYNIIDFEQHAHNANLIFSSGKEFYSTQYFIRAMIFMMIVMVCGITSYYYHRFLKKPHKNNIYYKQLSVWITFFIAPYILLIVFGMLWILNIIQETPATYLFSFFSLTSLLAILFRPKFLNRAQATLAFLPIQKMVGPSLSSQLFNNLMFHDFYYLQKDASLAQLAEKLQTTETNVREYLQQEYGMGINDFLNKQRITYLLQLLNDPENRRFTIEHLSQKAGFPSRSTMYRAFAKFHGGNPSDYLEKMHYA
ncbi:MAG: helix-turn-helix domain-containing protein [Chitinophagaceae bacterium]|nr:helix-turn-helix domain-containing protein [Chitinophagaceae bacterium]